MSKLGVHHGPYIWVSEFPSHGNCCSSHDVCFCITRIDIVHVSYMVNINGIMLEVWTIRIGIYQYQCGSYQPKACITFSFTTATAITVAGSTTMATIFTCRTHRGARFVTANAVLAALTVAWVTGARVFANWTTHPC